MVSLARTSVSQKDGVSITWGFLIFSLPLTFLPPLFSSLLFPQVLEGNDSPVIFSALIQGAAGTPSWGRLLLVTWAIERNSNGLTSGSLQDGEFILPPQPTGIPSTNGPGIYG